MCYAIVRWVLHIEHIPKCLCERPISITVIIIRSSFIHPVVKCTSDIRISIKGININLFSKFSLFFVHRTDIFLSLNACARQQAIHSHGELKFVKFVAFERLSKVVTHFVNVRPSWDGTSHWHNVALTKVHSTKTQKFHHYAMSCGCNLILFCVFFSSIFGKIILTSIVNILSVMSYTKHPSNGLLCSPLLYEIISKLKNSKT